MAMRGRIRAFTFVTLHTPAVAQLLWIELVVWRATMERVTRQTAQLACAVPPLEAGRAGESVVLAAADANGAVVVEPALGAGAQLRGARARQDFRAEQQLRLRKVLSGREAANEAVLP